MDFRVQNYHAVCIEGAKRVAYFSYLMCRNKKNQETCMQMFSYIVVHSNPSGTKAADLFFNSLETI
jgi:hypothetical protein